jgi:hypothetical protein
MKRVLRGNWAKRKPVFIGKILQSEGSGVPGSVHSAFVLNGTLLELKNFWSLLVPL